MLTQINKLRMFTLLQACNTKYTAACTASLYQQEGFSFTRNFSYSLPPTQKRIYVLDTVIQFPSQRFSLKLAFFGFTSFCNCSAQFQHHQISLTSKSYMDIFLCCQKVQRHFIGSLMLVFAHTSANQ